MNTFAEKLIITLDFLEDSRPGYSYALTLNRTKTMDWVVSVVGTSKCDKSLPFDFLTVRSSNFDEIPELIQVKVEELLKAELQGFNDSIERLQSKERELKDRIDKFKNLKL